MTTATTNTSRTDATVSVLMRRSTCDCGCGGRDPQHKTRLRRVIRNLRTVDEPVTERGFRVVERGEIKTPWGVEPVHRSVYGDHLCGWVRDNCR